MPITITTTTQFITDDGTVYNDTVQEVIDQDENAVAPLRYQCPVGTTREQILEAGTAEEFGAYDAAGNNTMMFINRDDSNTCLLYVLQAGGTEYRVTLGPGEDHYLPITTENTQYDAKFFNAPGRVEILAFKNPGS